MSNSTKIGSLGKIGEARLDLVPEVADCRPGIKPVEYNVVVAPAKMPDKIGALHIPDEYKDNQALAMQVGRIISMSPLAFDYANWPSASDRPQVGQIAWFARYAGKEFEGIDGKTYRILKDKDIGAVIEDDNSLKADNSISGLSVTNACPPGYVGPTVIMDRSTGKPFELDSFPLKEPTNAA